LSIIVNATYARAINKTSLIRKMVVVAIIAMLTPIVANVIWPVGTSIIPIIIFIALLYGMVRYIRSTIVSL